MENLPQRIAENENLSDGAKKKLQKIYDSIKCKDVITQAFDFLQLNEKNGTEIIEFRIEILNLLKTSDTATYKRLGDLLVNLFYFFDTLEGEDFEKIRQLDRILSWSNDEEKEANKLYESYGR